MVPAMIATTTKKTANLTAFHIMPGTRTGWQ
jgi:hypothetical protein